MKTRFVVLGLLVLGAGGCDEDGGGSGSGEGDAAADAGSPLDGCMQADAGPTDAGGADGGDADVAAPPPELKLDFVEIPLEQLHEGATELRFVPGTSSFLLTEKSGDIFHYRLEDDAATVVGTFGIPEVYDDLDCGVLAVAFDPEWETNHFTYFAHCIDAQHSRITRVVFDGTNHAEVFGTAAEIVSIGDQGAKKPWHNVGSIGFDATGAMWALFGDKTVSKNGQDRSNFLGSVARIVPSREVGGFGYEPAPDNPFADEEGVAPEIWAYGLRSPWRGHLDSRGRLWFGDVGANDYEEINVVTAPGQNFGWSQFEGPCTSGCEGLRDPVTYWDRTLEHDYVLEDPDVIPAEARVVWLGDEYRDLGNDRYQGLMTGKLAFGDLCLGYVRVIGMDDQDQVTCDKHVGHLAGVSTWTQGPDGYLYAVTYGACETIVPNEGSRLWRAVLAD